VEEATLEARLAMASKEPERINNAAWRLLYLGVSAHEVMCTGYIPALQVFMASTSCVTNYDYFLCSIAVRKKFFRALLLDEAHNAADKILNHVDATVSKKAWEELGITKPPMVREDNKQEAVEWIKEYFHPNAVEHLGKLRADRNDLMEKLEKERAFLQTPENMEKAVLNFSKEITSLERLLENVELFKISPRDYYIGSNKDTGALVIKPLFPLPYAGYFFKEGRQTMMMSATVNPSRIVEDLIGEREYDVLRLDSTFPIENRKIYAGNGVNMSLSKHRDAAVRDAKLRENVQEQALIIHRLFAKHQGQKGIIPSVSFKLNDMIYKELNDPRLVTHKSGGAEAAVVDFKASQTDCVLMSPSIGEGVDFRDEQSRFQIIPKVPFPNLGDGYIRARKEAQGGDKWYADKTAQNIVQMCGRSNRAIDDHAVTYILDTAFIRFFQDNETYHGSGRPQQDGNLPEWFCRAVVWVAAGPRKAIPVTAQQEQAA
jgi:ATP-dependent DNA helicase DinG